LIVLAVGDFWTFLVHVVLAAQIVTIRQLHDVGLVNGMYFLALVLAGVLKSNAGDARGSLVGDDFQAFHHAGDDFMFDSGIGPFSIFANDDEVDIGIAGWNVRQIPDGTEVGI